MTFIEYLIRNFLTPADRSKLPARVRAAVIERERTNEILARVIQLSIVLIFAFIYTVSPKTSPPEAFVPVPYVLWTYLILSVIGLVWSIRRNLPDWAVYGSILFDFALLYGLMISFHIQYMQPASFTLKAPTLLYVFIFIALRALRLESRFVIASGLVAALGWFAMIFYVTSIDPGDNMLTRSYVEYLTSNSVLIGAEVDKILTILFVTAILALAVNGSENLLVTAATEQSAARALSRFFDTSVASNIRARDEELVAGDGEKVDAVILNVDIRGFSAMAAHMEAGQVMKILSAYQSRIVPIVQGSGGVIDKFMGDGIMATFGVAGERGRPAADAVRAVEQIMADARTWADSGDPWLGEVASCSIGMGLASGTVAFGAVGQNERLEMTVIGAAVNLSAKLEKHNRAIGSVSIAAQATYDQALEQGYDGPLSGERCKAKIDGLGEQDIVVLSLPPAIQPTPATRNAEPA